MKSGLRNEPTTTLLQLCSRALTHTARMFVCLCAIILGLAGVCASSFAQTPNSITISRASGLIYLTSYVMEQRHLVEKHAALLGLPDLTINWRNVTQAGGQTDEFLSGRVEIANGGIGALLLLWDKTGGKTKAIVATVNHSVSLVTRDPKINALRDYETTDRIAVPTIGVSAHAIFLEMAAMQAFGKDQWARLNLNEVQMGQPTAFAAMTAPSHQVKSHAASPPFDALELAAIPEARVITTTADLPGNPRATLQFLRRLLLPKPIQKSLLPSRPQILRRLPSSHLTRWPRPMIIVKSPRTKSPQKSWCNC